MATTSLSPSEAAAVAALTQAHRAAQVRSAAKTAALVAAYYRTQVAIEDESSVARWLELVLPRIIRSRQSSATTAATFANTLRRLELPDVRDNFRYAPADPIPVEQIATSLRVVGVKSLQSKMTQLREDVELTPTMKQALFNEARTTAEKAVGGAVLRHVQNGGRDSIKTGVQQDPVALGYVRVTKGNPCFFCAMLASRGLVYKADSFDQSNARFDGAHNVKVHDSCACSLKASYRRDDPLLEQSEEWRKTWQDEIEGKFSGERAVYEWRRIYEGRAGGTRRNWR